LARRLCNGLPKLDGRPDFYMFRHRGGKEPKPVWMVGEPLTDEQIIALFRDDLKRLRAGG
jgi:hypothetical protein